MSLISIFIIILSALNDIMDLSVIATFPGINEVLTFMTTTGIVMLTFLDILNRILSGERTSGKY